MAKTLRAKTPEAVEPARPKIILFGRPGVGKTWVTLDFPAVYFIDVEAGATQPEYREKLRKAGGVYMGKEEGSQDFTTVIDEIRTLATVKHDHKTLVIDSFSKLYNLAAAQAELKVGNAYGAHTKEANKPTRQLMLWLERLDMNVILICHSKEKWARSGNQLTSEGKTFDGWEKMEYDLELCLEVSYEHGERLATVRKSRAAGFPLEESFPWSYAEFARRAAPTITADPIPFAVARPDQVATIRDLLDAVKVDGDWQDRVFSKAGVDSWEEMPAEKIQACIDHLSKPTAQKPPHPDVPAPIKARSKATTNGHVQPVTKTPEE